MNNEPVAWMVNDKIYQDIFEAEHYSKFTNKPMIPLFTQEQLEEARKLGMQQERALWNLSESTQEIMNTHPVKELTLTDEEIQDCYWGDGYPDNPRHPKEFAWAILRKASEK